MQDEAKLNSRFSQILSNQFLSFRILSFISYSQILQIQNTSKAMSSVVRALPPVLYMQDINFNVKQKSKKQIKRKVNWFKKELKRTNYHPRSFTLEVYQSLYDQELVGIIAHFIRFFAAFSSHLEVLSVVNHWKVAFEPAKIALQFLLQFHIDPSKMTSLTLTDCCTEKALSLLEAYPNLQILHLNHNRFLEGTALPTLQLEKLRSLKFQECQYIPAENLIPLIQKSKHTLTTLELDGQIFSDSNSDVLGRFLENMEHFQFIYGQGMEKVVPLLFQPNRFHTLQSYTFRQAPDLQSSVWLSFFSNQFEKLQILIIDNSNLSSAGLIKIGKMCKELVEIDISWNHCIVNEGVTGLLEGCQKLEEVRMIGLKEITQLPFTPETLPCLHQINFTQCNTVDENQMGAFFKSHPNARVIGYYSNLVHGPSKPDDMETYSDDFELDS